MRRLLAGLAGAATIVALWAAPADAHAELESTEPVGGTVLDDAPARVMLRFSEAVDVSADSVRVYDSDADRLRTGRPRHPEGRSAEVTVELPELRRGAYVVTWRAVSVDSHPVHGAFTFRVGDAPAGDAQALLERLVAADGGSTTVGVVYGLVRFAAFAALAALVGGTAFCVALWPAGLHHRTARRLIGASLLAAVATTAAVIVLQGVYSAALPLGDVFRWSVIEVVLETRFGLAWLVRLVLLVAAGPLLVVLFRGVRQGRSWPVIGLVVVGVVVLVTPGLGGHAGATHPAALHVAADAVHLGAACFWLGGLVLLVLALLRQPDDGDVTVVVPRFSRAAFVAVLVILATGAFQAWRQAGSVDAVTGTTYGRLVLTKVGLLAAIVVLAALSRSWVRRRALAPAVALGPGAMAASQPSLHQLRRSVGGEVAIAVAVLAVDRVAREHGAGPKCACSTVLGRAAQRFPADRRHHRPGQGGSGGHPHLHAHAHRGHDRRRGADRLAHAHRSRRRTDRHPAPACRAGPLRRLRLRRSHSGCMAARGDCPHQRHRPGDDRDPGPDPLTQEEDHVSRTTRLLALIAAVAIAIAGAPSAWAHVTVNPGEAEKGGFAKLSFRVPNERDDSGTTTVEVNFPAEQPIPFVSVLPHPGWTYTVERTQLDEPVGGEGEEITEVVSKITWTGGPIKPGEFDEFEVSAGPLPEDADQLEFKALQTYESGEVVRWIESTPASGEEPEHPAPVLRLVEGEGDAVTEVPTSETSVAADVASEDDVDSAETLAIVGLVVGGLALLVAVGAFLRGRGAPDRDYVTRKSRASSSVSAMLCRKPASASATARAFSSAFRTSASSRAWNEAKNGRISPIEEKSVKARPRSSPSTAPIDAATRRRNTSRPPTLPMYRSHAPERRRHGLAGARISARRPRQLVEQLVGHQHAERCSPAGAERHRRAVPARSRCARA